MLIETERMIVRDLGMMMYMIYTKSLVMPKR